MRVIYSLFEISKKYYRWEWNPYFDFIKESNF